MKKNLCLSNFANKSRYSKLFSSVIPRPKMLSLPIIILVAVNRGKRGIASSPSCTFLQLANGGKGFV